MPNCECSITTNDKRQRRVLVLLLSINAFMFIIEFGFGWIAQSTALIADALDMLADALVYAVGLYAVSKAAKVKAKAAMFSGVLQGLLGFMVLLDIARRFVFGSEPESFIMMVLGLIALIANVICLRLIIAHRNDDVHMRASYIFSKNDVIANLGVIVAGTLVWYLESHWPDILVGSIVVFIILIGAKQIINEAKLEMRQLTEIANS